MFFDINIFVVVVFGIFCCGGNFCIFVFCGGVLVMVMLLLGWFCWYLVLFYINIFGIIELIFIIIKFNKNIILIHIYY